MKACATCHIAYPSHFVICPRDATRLIEADEWPEGTLVRGRYRILTKLGRGGMGAVYKALHTKFNQFRALKVMLGEWAANPESIQRFEREALLMSKLQHPNVVRVDDIDETEDGRPFIVMELLEGRSLRQAIAEEGPFAAPRVCSLSKQAAAGLEAAHRLGMVHRDIKPDNLFLVSRPEGEKVKVLDFGIAKLKDARQGDALHTVTGAVIGTGQYLSPEQATGMRSDELDGRSDLYSLGLVMYQLLSRELPFHADTWEGWRTAHLKVPPRPILSVRPDLKIPEGLARLVMRCLEKSRDLRPASAQELIQEIERVEYELQQPAPVELSPTVVVHVPEPQGPPAPSASTGAPAYVPKPGEWPPGAIVRGKYRILTKIDESEMSVVYKVLHLAFEDFRGLRVFRPIIFRDEASRKKFKNELMRTCQLRHPNAMRVDDVDETEDGRPFMVTEFLEGRNLQALLKSESPFAPKRVCTIIKQAACALAAGHQLGLIHGDVKPGQFLLVDSPAGEVVKLMNYGYVHIFNGLTLTAGTFVGTLRYVPPEVVMGKPRNEMDGRMDLYPLGLVMYEMLTGDCPFKEARPAEYVKAVLTEPPQPIAVAHPGLKVPKKLEALVMRCLEKDPNLRPANAGEVIREIQQVEAEIQRPAAPHGSPAVVTPAASLPKDSKVPIAVRGSGAPQAKIGPWAEGQIIRGKYRVLEGLGVGGGSIFYKALQLKPEIVRAIEVASDEYREIFQQYAREYLKLQHPNVVCAVEVDEAEDGRLYMVREYVEGRFLDRVMQKEGPLAPLRACSIARQVAAGLGAAHALGVVHGEVYPLNIMLLVDPEGEKVKLTGLQGIFLRAAMEAKSPKDRRPCPSPPPAYASPEQLRGARLSDLDGRSNLFSLGVILYQMLTGEKPFSGENLTAVVCAVLTQQPKPVPTVRPDLAIPDSLANLVMRCLEKDRDLRPANAGEVIREIERIEGQM
jgi:serine/threonine protein kinase